MNGISNLKSLPLSYLQFVKHALIHLVKKHFKRNSSVKRANPLLQTNSKESFRQLECKV